MGLYVRVNYDNVYAAARKIAQEADNAEKASGELKSSYKDIDSVWRGNAGNTFSSLGDSWVSEMSGVSFSLKSLSGMLTRIADEYKELDRRLAEEARQQALAAEAKRKADEAARTRPVQTGSRW